MRYRHFLFLCLALLFPSLSYSLYNGSTALPEMPESGFFLSKNSFIAVKLGYEGDFLLGRNLDASVSDPGMTGMLNGATLALGFINRIEVYTLLGASETSVSCKAKGSDIHLKTGQNFGGEVGIRASTPIWGDMKFGADAKYFYAWPNLSEIKVNGGRVSDQGKVFQKEWQVGFSVSQTFAFFTPYIGGKFSRFDLEYVDLSSLHFLIPSETISMHNENPVGVFLGMGIAAPRGIYLDFEVRFIDEYAVTAALGASF